MPIKQLPMDFRILKEDIVGFAIPNIFKSYNPSLIGESTERKVNKDKFSIEIPYNMRPM